MKITKYDFGRYILEKQLHGFKLWTAEVFAMPGELVVIVCLDYEMHVDISGS